MVANKMTGPKGVIFTAKYIDRFHEYEDRLKAQELQVNQKALLLPKVYDGGLQAVEAAKAIVETETAPLKLELEAAKPKVSYYDSILSAPNAVSVTTIAKDYGMSAKALNEFLHMMGIIPAKDATANGLYSTYCTQIGKDDVRPGDILFRESGGRMVHMAVVGADGVYEAAGTAYGVVFRPWSDMFSRRTYNRMTGNFDTLKPWTHYGRLKVIN